MSVLAGCYGYQPDQEEENLNKDIFSSVCSMHSEEVNRKIVDVFMPLYPPVQCKDLITGKKEQTRASSNTLWLVCRSYGKN